MSHHSAFVALVIEQMSFIDGLRVRAMFGGYGVYRNDGIFAIIVDDRLYFKVDPTTRGAFEAAGLGPFTYVARGRSMTMQYFEAPPEVFEAPAAMQHWAQKALEAGTRAHESKTTNKQRTRKKPPTM